MAFAYTHGASAVRTGSGAGYGGAGSDGSKVQRFRFMTVAKRAASLDVAVGRQIKQDYELGAAPKSDYKHACFTAEALSLALDTDSSKEFASFARAIYSKVQSMPLLLHHKDEIVEQFVKALANQRTVAWRSLLKLIAVMARCVLPPVLLGVNSHAGGQVSDIPLRAETSGKNSIPTSRHCSWRSWI